jgi:hypothetical protein
MKSSSFFRLTSIASFLTVALLVVLGLIPWPFDFEFPGEAVLTGSLALSPTIFAQYLSRLHLMYAIDNLLITSWFIAWIGLGKLVRKRNKLMGNIVLVLGLIGPLLDFTENEFVWAMLAGIQSGLTPPINWFLAWTLIRRLSYVLPFVAGTVAALSYWSNRRSERIICLTGLALTAIAMVCLFIPALSLVPNLWWLFWFAGTGFLLWKKARKPAKTATA